MNIDILRIKKSTFNLLIFNITASVLIIGCKQAENKKSGDILNLRRLNNVEWKARVKDYKPIKIHAYILNCSKNTKTTFEKRLAVRKETIEYYREKVVSDPTKELRKLAKQVLDQIEKDLFFYTGWNSYGTPIMFSENMTHKESRGVFVTILEKNNVDIALTMKSRNKAGDMPHRIMVEIGKKILKQIREDLSSGKKIKIEKGSIFPSEGEHTHKGILKDFGKQSCPFPRQR